MSKINIKHILNFPITDHKEKDTDVIYIKKCIFNHDFKSKRQMLTPDDLQYINNKLSNRGSMSYTVLFSFEIDVLIQLKKQIQLLLIDPIKDPLLKYTGKVFYDKIIFHPELQSFVLKEKVIFCYPKITTNVYTYLRENYKTITYKEGLKLFLQMVSKVLIIHFLGYSVRDASLPRWIFVSDIKEQIVLDPFIDIQCNKNLNILFGCPAYFPPEIKTYLLELQNLDENSLSIRPTSFKGNQSHLNFRHLKETKVNIHSFILDGHAYDTWCLGVNLYILMTKHFPFYGNTMAELFVNITEHDLNSKSKTNPFKTPYFESLPKDIKNLIIYILNKDPLKRPSVKEIYILVQNLLK